MEARPPMALGRWLTTRTLPFLALTVAAAAVAGLLRSKIGFFVGLQGMAAGGLLGFVIGRIGRGDAEPPWTFGRRIVRSLGTAVVFAMVQIVTLALLHEEPLDWLQSVLNGYEGEGFYGYRRYREAASGSLTGGWWAFMNLVDLGLFAFLALAGQSLGYFPEEKKTAPDDEE